MEKNLTAKTFGLVAAALMILFASVALADIGETDTMYDMEMNLNRFQITPLTLPEISDSGIPEFRFISSETLGKILTEKAAFLEEIRPLRHDLKSKWTALIAELAKASPEATVTAHLQDEISALDTQLAQKRLAHLLALEEIKTNAGDHRL